MAQKFLFDEASLEIEISRLCLRRLVTANQ